MFSIIRASSRQIYRQHRFIYSSIPHRKVCPSCSQPLPSSLPACTNCWHISNLPKDTKFHDIFDLPYEPNPFVIDIPALKQRFRRAQAICHPDSWTSRGASKQDIAKALSTHVNEAYQCLLKPLSRAEYILDRHHIPISETDQVNNIEFMSKIMQDREVIDDAEHEGEVLAIIDTNRASIQRTVNELEASVSKEQWEEVKAGAIRLRYLEGIDQAANKWLEEHYKLI